MTLTQNSNDSSRTSKLDNFEYRVSSQVFRGSSRVVRVSSRGDKELIARLFFPKYMHMSILLTDKFSSRDCRGGKQLRICKSVSLLNGLFVPRLNFFRFGVNYH